jgi:hypothetical protein
MTLLQARTTKVLLCVGVFFVASGFASFTNIPVTNSSFQDLPDGVHLHPNQFTTSDQGIPGWVITPTSSPFTGQFHPVFGNHGHFNFFSPAPNGGDISAYSAFGTIEQDVGTVQEGQIYTLTVELGRRHDEGIFAASADLLVGSSPFPANGTPPPPGHWSTFIASFVGTTANEGEPIMIQLNAFENQGSFGSVRLTETPVPEPSSMLLLGSGVLGLAQLLRRKLM